jgi:hypothetical protein
MSLLQTAATRPDTDAKMVRIIALLDDLLTVIAAENSLLSSGLPASLAQSVERKGALASELDGWMGAIRSGEVAMGASDPANVAALVSRLQTLKTMMGENTSRIRVAMGATRRRIDGIMRALRDEPRQAGIYGADALRQRRLAEAAGKHWA